MGPKSTFAMEIDWGYIFKYGGDEKYQQCLIEKVGFGGSWGGGGGARRPI